MLELIATSTAAAEAREAAAAAQRELDEALYAEAVAGATVRQLAQLTGLHPATVRAGIRRAAPATAAWVDVPLFDTAA